METGYAQAHPRLEFTGITHRVFFGPLHLSFEQHLSPFPGRQENAQQRSPGKNRRGFDKYPFKRDVDRISKMLGILRSVPDRKAFFSTGVKSLLSHRVLLQERDMERIVRKPCIIVNKFQSFWQGRMSVQTGQTMTNDD